MKTYLSNFDYAERKAMKITSAELLSYYKKIRHNSLIYVLKKSLPHGI